MEAMPIDDALRRIRVEYMEMPDLKLTRAQARRLWNLTQEACDVALATLVRSGFLGQTTDGQFLRRGPDESSVTQNLHDIRQAPINDRRSHAPTFHVLHQPSQRP